MTTVSNSILEPHNDQTMQYIEHSITLKSDQDHEQ